MALRRILSPRVSQDDLSFDELAGIINRGDKACVELRKAMKGCRSYEATNSKQQTLLHIAAIGGHTQTAVFLLENKKANVNATDKDNWTPLFWACNSSNLEVAEKLIEHSAQVNMESCL